MSQGNGGGSPTLATDDGASGTRAAGVAYGAGPVARPSLRAWPFLCVLVTLLAWNAGCARTDAAAPEQPIRFNHRLHVEQGLGCDTCHVSVQKAAWSGLPTVDICLACHAQPMTDRPEEKKIAAYAASGKALRWVRIYDYLPGDVVFSHKVHVVYGKLDCATCHGNIAASETPPVKPAVQHTMASCVACHVRTATTRDCLACHK